MRTMGFNLMSRANNHSLDWGVEGMRETSRVLDENSIVHAGVGENLSQAGAARFLQTARGRVALVALATTFMPMSRACDPAGEALGRPRVNALRLTRNIVIPSDVLECVRRVRDVLPGYTAGERDPKRTAQSFLRWCATSWMMAAPDVALERCVKAGLRRSSITCIMPYVIT
ncbi:CapA family protein [Mesorhizobium sp.]|uniref:CapA family protein n=1 Tax=Mesorhizobium sp. TaxID=1871066 RepID=UPI00257BA323|nr:CapA family protein [Mesorhizobium sp.]